MKKDQLFEYLETQAPSVLLELLNTAFNEMNTDQRHTVFGKTIEKAPPPTIDGEDLLADIEGFYQSSLAGYYYEPFTINSKNFSDIPEETEEWFEKLGDHLKDSSRLTDQGDHEMAVECFKRLYKLIDKMEEGEEIIFAEEYGTWMIPGDEKQFIRSFLTSLSKMSTPNEYAEGAIPLIKRDSYESFHNKVYATAIKIAGKEQKKSLKNEVKVQNIRTKSKHLTSFSGLLKK